MEIIRQYGKHEREYLKLRTASEELTVRSGKGTVYTVGDCYFDLGQNWKWTTILARRSDGTTYQALCPRDYELILKSSDIPATVDAITAGEYWREL